MVARLKLGGCSACKQGMMSGNVVLEMLYQMSKIKILILIIVLTRLKFTCM